MKDSFLAIAFGVAIAAALFTAVVGNVICAVIGKPTPDALVVLTASLTSGALGLLAPSPLGRKDIP